MKITEVEALTSDVNRYTMARVGGEGLLPFQAGCHVETEVQTPNGPLRRHYSLCSPVSETRYYQIAVKRSAQSRGGSRFWHDHVRPGTSLAISPPINHFALSSRANQHILIAGGIGITPFIPMVQELQARGEAFELHYAASSAEGCVFRNWLTDSLGNQVRFYFSDQGIRMTPSVLSERKMGTHVYLCGPSSMMKEFREAAKMLGYPERNVHIEPFAAGGHGEDQPFQVILKRSQRQIRIPREKTLLQALQEQNFSIPYSCQAGGCGACQLPVLEGKVDHRDFYLTEAEQAQQNAVISCVSRAQGKTLTLDL